MAALLITSQPNSNEDAIGRSGASLPDPLATIGWQTGVAGTFIEDAALLESIGGVGAFLQLLE